METSGDLARKQVEYRDKVVGGIEAPKAVPGVKTTEAPRTYYVDPTVTVDRDIRNAEGTMLFARGVKVNPLDHVSLTRKLLFFDARDSRQVAFARRRLDDLSGKSKPILVAGEPLKLMRVWKQTVYYDQGGSLARRLGIRQVPAIVSQMARGYGLMKYVRSFAFLSLLAIGALIVRPVFATATCTGRFANPITSICWSCMMPLRFRRSRPDSRSGRHAQSRRFSRLPLSIAIAGRVQGEFLGTGPSRGCGSPSILHDQPRWRRAQSRLRCAARFALQPGQHLDILFYQGALVCRSDHFLARSGSSITLAWSKVRLTWRT